MQKISFSFRRTLAISTVSVLGLALNLAIIFYIAGSQHLTYVEWACLAIGIIIFSSGLQYALLNLIKRYLP